MSWESILAALGLKRLGEILAPFGVRLSEPVLIKKTAEARAQELKVLAESISEAEKILPAGTAIQYNKSGFTLKTKTDPQAASLIDRTRLRVGMKELRAQMCLEGVVAAAADELKDVQSLPDQKPDPTWTIRLLGYAEGMPESYVQDLWGKVLAGEIKHPGSYSMRTLDVLSAMTQKEAENFVAACQYVIWGQSGLLFAPRDTLILGSDSHVSYHAMSQLADIGLVHQGEVALLPFNSGASEYYLGFSDSALAVTKSPIRARVDVGLSMWMLTNSGRDLTRLVNWETPSGHIERVREGIRKLGWESRIGKIADYSEPHFEETSV